MTRITIALLGILVAVGVYSAWRGRHVLRACFSAGIIVCGSSALGLNASGAAVAPRPAIPLPAAATQVAIPYGPSSPWNQRVGATPKIAGYSARVIAQEFADGNTQPVRNQEAGTYDYGHPIYFATAEDPLVKLQCTRYCGTAYPKSMRVPAIARPAGGSDSHMAVIQPDMTEIDMWGVTKTAGNYASGQTIVAMNVANCGSYVTGSGFAADIGSTAGQACLGAGLLKASELLSGTINHALFLVGQCAIGTQLPTPPTAATGQCANGVGPPLGGRLWADVAAPSGLEPWSAAIWNALHNFGGYLMDNSPTSPNINGIGFMSTSGERDYVYGMPDPFAALAAQGWSSIPIAGGLQARWVGADRWNPPGLKDHLHWLAPP